MKSNTPLAAVLISAAALAAPAIAGDAPAAAPVPAPEGADFALQGEYAGTVTGSGKAARIGVQVIARGGGRFVATVFPGGLPGEGGEVAKRTAGIEGRASGSAAVFEKFPGGPARIEGATLRVGSDPASGVLAKVLRRSPTLGMRPPEGAVVLFDGPGKNDFEGKGVTPEGFLRDGSTSRRLFQGCRLHVEFCLPFEPTHEGQGRANSGLYLQGRYETQILDSFGLVPEGAYRGDCGDIYEVERSYLNMSFPPLSWQTYDVEFAAARFDGAGKKVADASMTVWHNGVLIHLDTKVPHTTVAAPNGREGPTPGPIYLQDHGNPVRFRNIWAVPAE